ncbi:MULTISPECIES: sensor histidine kinase [Flavobacterium]|uniref:histidine kinase n=1 Tax=Flavobacterium jumunjinense TaxID=998845 RepID=A0ABV5GNC7_9FLAO|nr:MULTISPECIES: sensor histidine kinase [Flavobacterium]
MNIKTFSIFFLLFSQFVLPNDTIVKTFKIKKEIEKVFYFRSLHQEDKLKYILLFKEEFFLLKNKNSTNKTQEKPYTFCLGLIDQLDQNHIKAISKFNKLLENKDYKLCDKERMDIYVAMQESYLKLNLYSKVFDSNRQINTLIEKGVDYPLWSYNIQSRLYLQLEKVDKAIIQLKKEINLLQQNTKRDSLIIPSAYNDLGFFYSLINKNDSALIYYNKGLYKAEKGKKKIDSISYRNFFLNVNENIANIYLTQKKYDKAITTLTALDSNYFNTVKKNNTYIDYKVILAKAYLGKKDFSKSKSIIMHLDSLNKNSKIQTLQLLNLKHQFAQETNNYKEAYKLLLIIKKNNDSISNIQKKKLLQSSELNFSIEENERSIIKKNKAIKEKEDIIFTIIITGLLLLLIISFIFISNNQRKRVEIERMSNSILKKNKEIEESLIEKELLLKEIHHRVKNNLQIISGILELQNYTIKDPKIKTILSEGQNRIQSIALLHKTIYQNKNFKAVNFSHYISEFITYSKQVNSSEKKIDITVNITNFQLEIDTAIPLSLILNEIINNAYKHAFTNTKAGKIDISLEKKQTEYKVTVQDNGIGFPDNFDTKNVKSFGFELINGLIKQINGNLYTSNRNGALLTIIFKTN